MKKSKILIIAIVVIILTSSTIMLLSKNKNIDKNCNDKIIATSNEKQIYGTYKTESSWVKDPSELNNLVEMGNNSSIVKVKVISIGEEAEFLTLTSPTPYTPIQVQIENIIEGNSDLGNQTIFIEGGYVKISNLLKRMSEEKIEKMGFDLLTEEEKNNMYVGYTSDYNYNLKIDEEYIMVLSNNKVSTIMAGGYGIFKETENNGINTMSSNGISFKNVLTGKTFNY